MKDRIVSTHFRLVLMLLLLIGTCLGISIIIYRFHLDTFSAIFISFPILTQGPLLKKVYSLHMFILMYPWIEIIPLFLVCLFFLTKPFSRYLIRVKGDVQRIARGEMNHRVLIKYNNELTELARTINRLVEQLELKRRESTMAEQSKDELIANVSHDLRTPLTSIVGYLDLINRGQYKDEKGLLYYVQVIERKANRLYRLIDDLFEYVVTRDPKVVLRLRRLNLKELLMQMVVDFKKKNDLEIRWSIPEEHIFVDGEGDKLARAFENLISNAIRYGDQERGIDIMCEIVGEKTHIRIVNYGLPIPELDLPYIFNRFYRVEKSRSEETGGTGLGLSIAKNIVEMHKGTIAVQSNEKATSFEVALPMS